LDKYAQEEWNAELAGCKCDIELNLIDSATVNLDALKADTM
jgi:hypothetical protein